MQIVLCTTIIVHFSTICTLYHSLYIVTLYVIYIVLQFTLFRTYLVYILITQFVQIVVHFVHFVHSKLECNVLYLSTSTVLEVHYNVLQVQSDKSDLITKQLSN